MAKKVADEIVTEEVINSEEKACKKNGKKVLIAVIAFVAVAILCVGGFFLYRMLKTNDPVNVTSDAIRGLKDTFNDVKDEHPGLTKIMEGDDPFEINTDITVKLPKGMGKYTANILAQVDSEKEAIRLDMDAKSDKETLLALSAVMDGAKLYFSLPDTMSKYYFMDMTKYLDEIKSSLAEVDTKKLEKAMDYDYTKLVDYLADAIEDTFDKKDFKKTSDEITVNDKDIKVNKYSTEVTAEKAAKVVEKFLNKVLNDKELIEVVAELSDMKESDVKDQIKDFLAELKDTDFEGNKESLTYNVYVSKTGKAIGYSIEINGTEVMIAERGDVTELTISAKGVSATIAFEKKSDEHYVITAYTTGISATIDIKDEVETVKKNKEYKETLSIDFELSAMGQSMNASLKAVSTIKKIDSIKTVKDAVDIEKMNATEQQEFLKEFEQSSLYKLIESFSKTYLKNTSSYNVVY